MKIATRSSKLALKQVEIITNQLKELGLNFEKKKQLTEGDKKVNKVRIFSIKPTL